LKEANSVKSNQKGPIDKYDNTYLREEIHVRWNYTGKIINF